MGLTRTHGVSRRGTATHKTCWRRRRTAVRLPAVCLVFTCNAIGWQPSVDCLCRPEQRGERRFALLDLCHWSISRNSCRRNEVLSSGQDCLPQNRLVPFSGVPADYLFHRFCRPLVQSQGSSGQGDHCSLSLCASMCGWCAGSVGSLGRNVGRPQAACERHVWAG
jgi:hypothetical protein